MELFIVVICLFLFKELGCECILFWSWFFKFTKRNEKGNNIKICIIKYKNIGVGLLYCFLSQKTIQFYSAGWNSKIFKNSMIIIIFIKNSCKSIF